MRRFLGFCLMAVGLMVLSAEAPGQMPPSYVSPWVPDKAGRTAADKAREAAIRILQAHCTLTDAQRDSINNSNDQANKSVTEAQAEYRRAGQMLLDVSKLTDASIRLNPPDRDDVTKADDVLKSYGIKIPTSYSQAFAVLADDVLNEQKALSEVKFRGEPSDLQALKTIMLVRGQIAEIYLAITTLTIYGSG